MSWPAHLGRRWLLCMMHFCLPVSNGWTTQIRAHGKNPGSLLRQTTESGVLKRITVLEFLKRPRFSVLGWIFRSGPIGQFLVEPTMLKQFLSHPVFSSLSNIFVSLSTGRTVYVLQGDKVPEGWPPRI